MYNNIKNNKAVDENNAVYVFGLNHESASFSLRERFAFTREEIAHALSRLQKSGVTQEVIILSTCNRTEIYCITHDIEFVINAICDLKNVCPRTIRQYSYVHMGNDCARHLFKVASGLDSMIFGETEIVAQIKAAKQLAVDNQSIATHLTGLFQIALSVEKDVRASTHIHATSSIGGTVVKQIKKFIEDGTIDILFIGAGSMMATIIPHFNKCKTASKMIVNRTVTKAEKLAKTIDASSSSIDKLPEIVNNYNVIICCSGGGVILDKTVLQPIIKSQKEILIIDLSMPLITDIHLMHSNISILTMDDIARVIEAKHDECKQLLPLANDIIQDGISQYNQWLTKHAMSEQIRSLRDSANDAREELLASANQQIKNGDDPKKVLDEFSVKLMNKLLHRPTIDLLTKKIDFEENATQLTREPN